MIYATLAFQVKETYACVDDLEETICLLGCLSLKHSNPKQMCYYFEELEGSELIKLFPNGSQLMF